MIVPYGEHRRYQPDFRIEYTDGRVVIEEVKPFAYLSKETNVAKFAAARMFLAPKGIEFRVITEREIGFSAIKKARVFGLAGPSEEERAARKRETDQAYRARNRARENARTLAWHHERKYKPWTMQQWEAATPCAL